MDKKEVRPIDANALARKIREYMEDFPNAVTRLATCRVVLSMLGDEGQTPTILQPTCNNVATDCKPLTIDQLREIPRGKIKDSTLQSICDRANEIARKPAHIDWKAWEPCESCISCENCKNNGDYDPYEGSYGECGPCYGFSNFEPSNFCRECGRPLTKEANAELEKRLRG